MLDNRIKFEERYDNYEYATITLYFTAPKEMLMGNYPEAVSATISVEFPMDDIKPRSASIDMSPTDSNGSDYDWYRTDLPYHKIEELIKLAGIVRLQKFNAKENPKTYAYVMENDTVNRRCNKCGSVVLRETNIEGYPYQCMDCDENMYEIETHIGEPHTEEELDDLLINTLILCLDD